MSKLRPNNGEIDILRDMFSEAGSFHGEHCKLVIFEKFTSSDGVDDGKLSDPIEYETNIFFDEFPNVRTLKSLNWYSEDAEILPSIIHIPCKIDGEVVRIREGSKLQLIIGEHTKEYKIGAIRASYKHVISYTCKLTPWFDTEVRNDNDTSFDESKHDKKYSFFNVDKEDGRE